MTTNTESKLNTAELATPDQMASYEAVQAYAQKNGIKSMRAWFLFHNPRKGGHARPRNIPGDPSKYFGRRDQWSGWSDFLGTDTKPTQVTKEDFLGEAEVKQWFIANKIYTVTQFREICKNGERPTNIPSAPDKKFQVKFSELLCPRQSPYLNFNEAKAKVRKYGLKSYLEFREFRRDNMDELGDIPCNPDKIYEKSGEWTSWPDFLGYSRIR